MAKFHSLFYGWVVFHSEKAMAPHSSTLAWQIPWMEEPGRLQSMGSQRVGHDWATSLFTFMHWRRKWHPTPVFLPGESQGQGSLVGCHLCGHTESDTTEAAQQQHEHGTWTVLCWVYSYQECRVPWLWGSAAWQTVIMKYEEVACHFLGKVSWAE